MKTSHETMIFVRYHGLGSDVVDRLITPSSVIRILPSKESADTKKTTVKHSDFSPQTYSGEQETATTGEKKFETSSMTSINYVPEVSDNSSLSNSGENDVTTICGKKTDESDLTNDWMPDRAIINSQQKSEKNEGKVEVQNVTPVDENKM